MWVITYGINEYNQEGEYLDRVFDKRPTKEELDNLGYDGEHLLNGGGRKDQEFTWYYLTSISSGQKYIHR